MERYFIFLLSILLSTLSLSSVSAKYARGELISIDNWEFITRFCFLSEAGTLDYEFSYKKSYKIEKVLLYFDTDSQWKSVYKTDTNCTQKMSVLDPKRNQIIQLTEVTGCVTETIDGEENYVCRGQRFFRSARERWWFIAVSRCEPVAEGQPVGLHLKYNIHMTNGDEGDYLHREYSADEFYIMPIATAFLLLYMGICLLVIVCGVMLYQRQLLHATYKLYMATIFTWTFYLFLLTCAYGVYGNDGDHEKLTSTKYAARSFQSLSTLLFLLMLILMAKGFTITRGRLSAITIVMITTFFVIFTLAYVVVFIYEGLFFDPGLVLYTYESPAGYGLVALRLVGWAFFCFATLRTLYRHRDKSAFYWPFYFFYTAWFWAGPIIIIVAALAIAQWTREKVVVAVECFVAALGHLFFLVLTRPSQANSNFPYHIRTTQIGIMSTPPESESYGNSMYAVTTNLPDRPNSANLFYTAQARSSRKEDTSLNNNTSPPTYMGNGIALPQNGDAPREPSVPPPAYDSMFRANGYTGHQLDQRSGEDGP